MKPKEDHLQSVLERAEDLDVTSLRTLISRLAKERTLFQGILTSLREGILVIDASGSIEYANTSASSLLGFKSRDLSTSNLWKQVPDLRRTLEFTGDGDLLSDRGITREIELTYPEWRIVRLYLFPFDLEAEEGVSVARYAVILSDVTQEKEQTQQQIENERVQSILQLSAGVAHELGNPLNSLNIHLQVVERSLKKLETVSPATEKLSRSLEVCLGEVDRLDSIITHFLEAVRPTSPDFSDLDLIAVLEEAVDFLMPELESAGVRVEASLDRTVPIVEADRNQIKQIFFNLLKNARQAMKPGGTIKVAATSDDEFVYLRVADNGSGIAEEDLPRIFQPYFSTKQGGHGLGMMIVERIMRDHGGQVGIDSKQGTGTVVTLHFPQKHRRIRMLAEARK